MKPAPLISLVVPAFNEEMNIGPFYGAVRKVIDSLNSRYQFEFVFTDNHSTDRTPDILRELAKTDSRVRAYRFSKNFGYQASIMSGYLMTEGDAAIQLDCDLQDPPELIPVFLKHWEEGHDVVYGIRQERQEGFWITSVRRSFYRLIGALSEDRLPNDAGDFRLVSRRIIEELKRIEDAQPYIRGTIATLGFSQIGIPYTRNRRERGESKFSFLDLLVLALDGILNHSIIPLRIATFVGLTVFCVTLLLMLVYLIGRIFFGHSWPAGFTTLVLLVLAGISLNAMFFGISGEYLGRIYRQVKRRPLTIIEERIPPLPTTAIAATAATAHDQPAPPP
ncbi:MAG: glycosyltransferase family 2 protein [Candidatus Korobacteraceae bacterium]|jgi:dolichol-phosphate mannosyltransferase